MALKIQLPETIQSAEQARQFLDLLCTNNLTYHPEDSAHDVDWHLPTEELPTHEECEQLDKLMADIYNMEGNNGNHATPKFCPCEYILMKDEAAVDEHLQPGAQFFDVLADLPANVKSRAGNMVSFTTGSKWEAKPIEEMAILFRTGHYRTTK